MSGALRDEMAAGWNRNEESAEAKSNSALELPGRRRFKPEVKARQRELETVAAPRHDKSASRR